jgi:xanthine dioxygenase
MAIELLPLPLPASADASKFVDFGREVKGVNPGSLNLTEFAEIREALYKVSLFFRLQLQQSRL